jgi:hypothetical protein
VNITEIGAGHVETVGEGYYLMIPAAHTSFYSDAQVADYQRAGDFRHKPPLRLHLKARFEGELRGTAGFGFWNHPFMPGARRLRLPRAVWYFFASSPSNMALALNVSGHGWKAATFDAQRWSFFALLPLALPSFVLMRIPALYRRLWPIGQRAIGVSEALLDSSMLMEEHEYLIDWLPDQVVFQIDGQQVHRAPASPGGPLGFVAWVDNQYAVVTPQGWFAFGFVASTQYQAMHIHSLAIEPLA